LVIKAIRQKLARRRRDANRRGLRRNGRRSG